MKKEEDNPEFEENKELKEKVEKKSGQNGIGNGKSKTPIAVVDLEEELNLEELMKQKVTLVERYSSFMFSKFRLVHVESQELLQARLGACESSGEEDELKKSDSKRRNDQSSREKAKDVEMVEDSRTKKEKESEKERDRDRERDRAKDKDQRREKERDRDEERSRDREREKEREKEKEKVLDSDASRLVK